MTLLVSQFNEQFLLQLTPKDKEYIVSENLTKGFAVRVFPSGVKTFVYNKGTGRSRKRASLGQVGTISIEEARKSAIKLGAVIQFGELNTSTDKLPPSESTKFQLSKLYLSYDWGLLSDKSQNDYSKHLDKLVHHSTLSRISSLTSRSVLKSYLDEIAKDKPVSANRAKAAISKFINFLVDTDTLPYNVTHRMKKYPEKARKRSIDAPQELRVFLKHINQSSSVSELTRDSIKLYLLTGCRKTELRLMHKRELALGCSTFTLPEERSKTSERIIPLVDTAKAILRKYSNNTGMLLINDKGKALADDTVNQAMTRTMKKLELEKATCHDLRRTCGTIMARQRVSLELRKRVLGHQFTEMSEAVYNVFDHFDEKLEALQKVESYLIEYGLICD